MRLSLVVPLSLFFVLLLSIAPPLLSQEGRVYPNPSETQEYYDQIDEEARQKKREYDRKHEWRDSAFACRGCGRRPEGIQVQAIPDTDLIAVLHDIDLEDEFVMVRLRFYNDGSEPASLVIDPATGYESFAISAGGETLHILREGNGDLAAKKRLDLDVRPGAMESWWALFPALPAGTETFDLVVPPAPPFEGVPVSAQ